MAEEASLEFRLRKIGETRNYLSEEIDHNDSMNRKFKKTCKYLNYVEHLIILVSTVTGCVIAGFALLVCVSVGIAGSVLGIKIGIKRYKSIIKKKKREHDGIVLLGRAKLNAIEVLISKALIDSHISCDQFISVNSAVIKYNKIKEEIKIFVEYTI